MQKKVLIIGAGMAGICAGSYLRMNGYDVEIFEKHIKPGGLCTAWKRNGFIIDGCLHWLVGSSPADNFYYLWKELIDIDSINFVDHEIYLKVEDSQGNNIQVYADIDRFEKELLAKAPEDVNTIKEIIHATRKLLRLNLRVDKAPEIMNLWDALKFMWSIFPFIGTMRKYISITAGEFSNRCRNPLLRQTFQAMFEPEMSLLFLMFTLGWMHKKSAGYPVGGSLAFARLFENTFNELGGKLQYRSKVQRILVENDTAMGIELENGEIHLGDLVVSAADGHTVLFNMLGGKYMTKQLKEYYSGFSTFPSLLQISFGIEGALPQEADMLAVPVQPALNVDPLTKQDMLVMRVFNFDPTLSPIGHTLITVMISTRNFAYWDELRKNNLPVYQEAKNRIGVAVKEIVKKRYNLSEDQIVLTDVATPATYIRYTGNWQGSYEGWLMTPRTGFQNIKKNIPSLKNFYMCGQWVEPGGGVPSAIMSGRNVAQLICKKDKKKFTLIKR